MIDHSAVCAADLFVFEGTAYLPGDVGQMIDVGEAQFFARVIRDKEPISAPGDIAGDGAVDMIYFSDTNEIFMYREGMRNRVAEMMPLHRCAVPLNEGMQRTTDRILHRKNMVLKEELTIAKELIVNYAAAKPEIDACNAYFDKLDGIAQQPEDEFFMGEWDDD